MAKLDRQRAMAVAGRLAAPFVALAFRGNRLECPICGGRFRAFRSFGRTKRPDALCPRCGSLERTRALWLHLESMPDLANGRTRVLHVAPERSISHRLGRRPGYDYVTGDLERADVDMTLDVTAIPFDDSSFDLVICSHVLEHVPDDRLAMREMLRILRPGGIAVLMVPEDVDLERTFEDPSVTAPAERERLFNQRDHVRIYGRDFEQRLRDTGFDVERIDLAAKLGPELAERYALVERPESGSNPFRSDIYSCVKPA